MDVPLLADAISRCEGYSHLKMWEHAWNELEDLPAELRTAFSVLIWRIKILMGMGEFQKASFVGMTLVDHHPDRLESMLLTSQCLFELTDNQSTHTLLRNAVVWHPNEPRLWMMLARTEARLGNKDSAKDCVQQFSALYPEGRVALLDLPELAFLFD